MSGIVHVAEVFTFTSARPFADPPSSPPPSNRTEIAFNSIMMKDIGGQIDAAVHIRRERWHNADTGQA